MEFKVLEYRAELRDPKEGAVPEAALVVGADGTRRWRPEALEQLGDCLRWNVRRAMGFGRRLKRSETGSTSSLGTDG